MTLTKFDKSIIKIAILSPNIISSCNFEKIKEEVINFITPYIGVYYVIKEKDGEKYLDTILEELSSFEVSDDFIDRFLKERYIRVCKLDYLKFERYITDSGDFPRISKEIPDIKKTIIEKANSQIGKIIFEGWESEYQLKNNEYIVCNAKVIKEYNIFTFEVTNITSFIDTACSFQKDYIDLIIKVLSANSIPHSTHIFKYQIQGYNNFYPSYKSVIDFFIDKLKKVLNE